MKKICLALFLYFSGAQLWAQVKIGAAGNPNANAVLELDGGTNKGFLLPRLSNPQMLALSSAPDGLMLYNTTDNSIYIRKISVWRKVTDALDGGSSFSLPYEGSASASAGLPVFKIQNSGAGTGISGEALGAGYGVFGYSNSGTGGYFSSVSGPALITGTGNVGIGTSLLYPPSFPLDINGRVRIRQTPGNTPGIWFDKPSGNVEPGAFLGVLNDSTLGIYGQKHGLWKFFFNHDNNNFGIYNSNPRSPLSFQAVSGSKIDLYSTGANAVYGLGIASAELQLFTDNSSAHTSFGYGSSSSFTETYRLNHNGSSIITNPVSLGNAVENVHYFKTNNFYTGAVKTIGTGVNTARLGLFAYASSTASGLKEYLSITDDGNVGLNLTNPTRPLSFPATLGKKISLYPGSTGDVGLSVEGNELRMYSDNSNAVITMGYDDYSNGYKEQFRSTTTGTAIITNTQSAQATNVEAGIYLKSANSYMGALKSIGTSAFAARLGFFTGSSISGTNLTERMTVMDHGAVGINNTNPNSTLQVTGSVSMSYREITGNYTITDNDYSIRYKPQSNIFNSVTLPAAAGRTGRIYIISGDFGYSSGVFYPALYVYDNAGNNVIAYNAAYYDGASIGGLTFNALMYVQFNNGETSLPVKRKVSITVQSNGSRWEIIDGDFKN
ncbi:MAG: hypothetical protein QM687_05240 [Ferruginibacter sp.]